ncbi:hypothetical protein BKH43_03855 [Helicobacter sp. 13S00401-1]|uniref:hypothetical protein n=1 Tax=Helicobacter sp. 13S00401-1 TaxID=1905758 RepID=UPI000BA7B5F3|nr:hypothetical protein [Helicobacter sp. 13S00401-1]PAF50707.1 hypothetical protein BKH43_03855 [Helicobacter sp. 13S00401-1]
MTYEMFSNKLKELNLSKEDFAKLVNMHYHSVANWSTRGVASWVEPFLLYYEKSKKLDEVLNMVDKYVKK